MRKKKYRKRRKEDRQWAKTVDIMSRMIGLIVSAVEARRLSLVNKCLGCKHTYEPKGAPIFAKGGVVGLAYARTESRILDDNTEYIAPTSSGKTVINDELLNQLKQGLDNDEH